MKYSTIFLAFLFLLISGPSLKAEPFGHALIQEGQLIVVRNGKESSYLASPSPLPISKGDLLRVGDSSRVLLSTQEGTQIILGAQAILQIKAWRQGQQKGYVKMLYGKAEINQEKVKVGQRNFRLRTVNTVVGVRGTGWYQQTTVDGNTLAATQQGTIQVAGLQGDAKAVSKGQTSVILSGNPASEGLSTPQGLAQEFQTNLGATAPNLPEAKDLWNETLLLDLGMINRTELIFSKIEQAHLSEGVVGSPVIEAYDPQQDQEPDQIFDEDYNQSRPQESQDVNIEVDYRPTTQIEVSQPTVEQEVGAVSSVKTGLIQVLFEY